MHGAEGLQKVVIDPVTRIEGHGKVTILLDEQGRVREARMHVVEFRGFERFVLGRPFWEMPVVVQRLCGICPVSHHLAAAKAMDRIVGGENLTPTAEKMRRLMHYGQIFQSHALHFFYLALPDLLFGFDANPELRNVVGMADKHSDLVRQGIMMRKYGQDIIKATAGKNIHGTGAIPGGINKNLSIEERDLLLRDLHQMIRWSRNALSIASNYTIDHLYRLASFGSFPSNHLSIVDSNGCLDFYDGQMRAVDAQGSKIFDHVECEDYLDYIAEEVRSWSYMKFPFIKSLGPRAGWYRVGPLARVNTCDYIDTPEAEAARKEFLALTDGKPSNITLAYHWARMIELLHAIEKVQELLHDPDLHGNDLVVSGPRRQQAISVLEAPRGTLFHHYKVNEDDQVTMANFVVATTQNNQAMNCAVQKVAEEHLSGHEITEGLLNRIEVAIRAYDPCLSCATHALGQMPLVVELLDYKGNLLDREVKG